MCIRAVAVRALVAWMCVRFWSTSSCHVRTMIAQRKIVEFSDKQQPGTLSLRTPPPPAPQVALLAGVVHTGLWLRYQYLIRERPYAKRGATIIILLNAAILLEVRRTLFPLSSLFLRLYFHLLLVCACLCSVVVDNCFCRVGRKVVVVFLQVPWKYCATPCALLPLATADHEKKAGIFTHLAKCKVSPSDLLYMCNVRWRTC